MKVDVEDTAPVVPIVDLLMGDNQTAGDTNYAFPPILAIGRKLTKLSWNPGEFPQHI
ncbi:hypothetical protein [Aestuariivirga sp.]|uniref:hypothetical protein n=1 Tax=Aestuariivirga sp. TaxID=2650926 RepID=UPI003BAC6001